VSQQSLVQQKGISRNVVTSLDQRLQPISSELQISNVIPALSPSTRRVLQGNPAISQKNYSNNAFNDDLISSISNPDINVAVY
ncbi:MAG TPA: sensor histidine kinase, partial [Lactobacillus acetotolerans]|nr:sensor histidine kinase [Lactobacillus acetotolerans]